MTYEESAELMSDSAFRGRVKVGLLKFADYLALEAATTPGHNSRYKWAVSAFQNPDMVAQQLQPIVVMDPAVQLAGASVSDEALQSAIEGVVNKIV